MDGVLLAAVDVLLEMDRRPLRARGRKKQAILRDMQLSHDLPSIEMMHRSLR